MVRSDRSIGTILHVLNTLFFVYWFLWIAVTPFVDESHFTQKWFPAREYGILIPVVIVSTLLVVGMSIASFHIIRQTGVQTTVAVDSKGSRTTADAAASTSQRAPSLQGTAAARVQGTSPRGVRPVSFEHQE